MTYISVVQFCVVVFKKSSKPQFIFTEGDVSFDTKLCNGQESVVFTKQTYYTCFPHSRVLERFIYTYGDGWLPEQV